MAAAVQLPDPTRFAYLKPKDVARLAEAYRFSEAAHAGQTRQSGDPYISHPLAVAEILAEWHLDGQALMAALLHDVTEDTSVTKDEISDTFGRPVAELVDGVSKLDRIEFQSAEDAQAENFRKMLLAMARDVRVILIKLADRLHNMRTLEVVLVDKQELVARGLLYFDAGITNPLGLNQLKYELEDLSFHFLHPTRFRVLDKANGYQSLHTTLFGPFGMPIEIQIRTQDMHKVAEAGVASHWMYKSLDGDSKDVELKTHQWLQSLLEIQSESGDALEFLEHIKVDLFPDEVYVFSPKGKIFALPKGATPIDFAYSVHTEVGNHCIAAKVDGSPVPLGTVLRNGNRVEIVTDPQARPNPVWLSYVATGKARSHIRHYLKTMQLQESAEVGELLLGQALRSVKVNPAEIGDAHWTRFFKGDAAKTREEVLADIGLGQRLAVVVAKKLLSIDGAGDGEPRLDSITIRGTEGLAVQFAPCCRPIPGDPINAQIKKGQGLVLPTPN